MGCCMDTSEPFERCLVLLPLGPASWDGAGACLCLSRLPTRTGFCGAHSPGMEMYI